MLLKLFNGKSWDSHGVESYNELIDFTIAIEVC